MGLETRFFPAPSSRPECLGEKIGSKKEKKLLGLGGSNPVGLS
jgi:hypothetical protein